MGAFPDGLAIKFHGLDNLKENLTIICGMIVELQFCQLYNKYSNHE